MKHQNNEEGYNDGLLKYNSSQSIRDLRGEYGVSEVNILADTLLQALTV